MAYNPVTHVLFDMDGLILNTEDLYTVAFQSIASRFNKEYTYEIKVPLMGTQAVEAAQMIIEKLELPMTVEEFLIESKQLFATLFQDAEVLPDTEDLYTVAFQSIASRFNKEYTYEIKVPLMGTQAVEAAQMIIEKLELPMTVEEFLIESKQLFATLFQDAEVLPGAKRLIEHLHVHNIPIALATSSTIESYELKTRKYHQELFSLFPNKVFGSSDPEVKKGKPSPDIFLVAANRFPDKPQYEKCLVFEDAVSGVKAAKAAGMQVVMVPDRRLPRSLTTDATLVLDSLDEFKPELFGLPPFKE